ncbi:3437_t:CDS:2 [Gigaspora margarita]|uniref:3437_t:CDS:1 n=1 Tax=Gigaspora margarita TaxID=4874 RepID=A0ABN7UZ72_GIGMA|nr:3437_t:CDS:2 [Gigaspora margarita]
MIYSNISSNKLLEKVILENHIKYINCDQLTEYEEIAKGTFGHISKAVWKVHKITVALKSLRADVSNTIEDFVKESSCDCAIMIIRPNLSMNGFSVGQELGDHTITTT